MTLSGGLGLDHHDRDVGVVTATGNDAAGDDHVEDGVLELIDRRERNPLAGLVLVRDDECNAHATDGSGERQAGDLRRRGSGVDGHDVVQILGVEAHDRDDDLDLVTETVDE